MKSKLGILGAMILSLAFAGSALAANQAPKSNMTKNFVAAKTVKAKKHRKHRRHRAAKKTKAMTKTTTTTTTTKTPPK